MQESCRQASTGELLRLLEAVQSAKLELSEREETSMCLPAFQGRDLVIPVTRADLEQATAPLLRRLWPPLRELGRQACVAWAARQASCALVTSFSACLVAAAKRMLASCLLASRPISATWPCICFEIAMNALLLHSRA